MIPRRRFTAAASVLAAVVAACGPSGSGGLPDGPFGHGGTAGAHCVSASPGQVRTDGDQFFQNPGPWARVTSLSLAHDHGLELLSAWIVQITGHTLYGNWPGWPVNRPQLRGVHWDARQEAVGASIAPTSGLHGYNIVLAIRLAPGRREGWARGITVRYHSGGQDYKLLTATRIEVVTRFSMCQSLMKRVGI
jgi:hypothetical protein